MLKGLPGWLEENGKPRLYTSQFMDNMLIIFVSCIILSKLNEHTVTSLIKSHSGISLSTWVLRPTRSIPTPRLGPWKPWSNWQMPLFRASTSRSWLGRPRVHHCVWQRKLKLCCWVVSFVTNIRSSTSGNSKYDTILSSVETVKLPCLIIRIRLKVWRMALVWTGQYLVQKSIRFSLHSSST